MQKVLRYLPIALALIVLLITVAVSQRQTPKQDQQLTKFWQEVISDRGAVEAAKEFSEFQKTQSSIMQHRMSHLFGAALYRELGTEAIVACTFEYESGCMHEVFRQASERFGSDSLEKLEQACEREKKSEGLCQHAFGHGLLANYGRDKVALNRALEICSRQKTGDPVLGCAGGVFMEYNGYILTYPELAPRDPEHGWYEPCIGISDEHMRACVWWLPRWWVEYLSQRTESAAEIYQRAGELCRSVPAREYRRECFEALGQKVAVLMSWDVKKIIDACSMLAQDAAEELLCRSYAASMFINSEMNEGLPAGVMISSAKLATQAKGSQVCAGLSQKRMHFCESYANNEHYIYNELPIPTE